MNKCATCKFYEREEDARLGECSRWIYSYTTPWSEVKLNEIVVEIDEGWGASMGPDFGCVLHELKYDGTR